MQLRYAGLLSLIAVSFAWSASRPPGVELAQTGTATTVPAADPKKGPIGTALVDGYGSERQGAAPPVRVLVATLPDPFASHLDWAFDSHLDAIRRAFERADYVLDRFDLPWTRPGTDRQTLKGRPGALLFRRAKRDEVAAPAGDLWLVYLVGELSTQGVDRDALSTALEERHALVRAGRCPDRAQILVVGPTFSGSARSLRGAFESAGARISPDTVVEIVTGAATSDRNAPELTSEGFPKIRFSSTLHTDGTLLAAFGSLLADFGLEARDVAVLKEGTTAYGDAFAPEADDAEPFDVVPFPMSLGSLRRAATRATAAGTAVQPLPGDAARTRTDLDLTDEPLRAETTGAMAKPTPASIDLLLEEMARMLARRGTKAVLLFASDVRDKLFLGAELKKRLPDLLLFTFEGNVLFLRPEYNRWLRGMVVLSTYPLLVRDQGSRPQTPGTSEELLFANEGAEGTFNATLVQIGAGALVADYGPPTKEHDEYTAHDVPSVWATVVGAGTTLPLAAWHRDDTPERTPIAIAWNAAPQFRSAGDVPSFLVLAWVVLVVFAIAWVTYRDAREDERRPRPRPRVAARASLGTDDARQEHLDAISLAIHRDLYRALLHSALFCLVAPHVTLLLARGPLQSWTITTTVVIGLAGLAVSVVVAWRATSRALAVAHANFGTALDHLVRSKRAVASRFDWGVEVALRLLTAVCGILYVVAHVALCAQILALRFGAEPSAFALFFQRTTEVDQGVSMLVPLTLVGVLLAAWSAWHASRLRGLESPTPAECALASPRPSGPNARKVSEPAQRLARSVRDTLQHVLPARQSLPLLGAITVVAAWLFFQFGVTHDGAVFRRFRHVPSFDLLLRAGIVAALAASAWAAVRLVTVWRQFRRLLHVLDGPLSALPFADLRQKHGVRASVGLWPAMNSEELESAAQERWRALAAHRGTAPSAGGEEIPLGTLEELGRDRTSEDALVRTRAHDDALDALRQFLDRCFSDPPRTSDARDPSQTRPFDAVRRATDEVVAVEIVLYVEWVLRKLRMLAFFLLLSVVLTTILISSYPFRPQALAQTISLFVFAGVVACLVWLIGALNRNPSLSRAAGSKPGELTWDRTLYANLALYVLVPVLALVSSQFPALRETLFKWLEPLAKFLVTA